LRTPLQLRAPHTAPADNNIPAEKIYFETEEEALHFEEASFDAPVPAYFLNQMQAEEETKDDDSTTVGEEDAACA